jgi:hypothetical protein
VSRLVQAVPGQAEAIAQLRHISGARTRRKEQVDDGFMLT